MKFLKLNLIIAFLSIFTLSTCKKGVDDPAISLLSRKNRLTGTWSLTKGYVSLTSYKTNTAPFNSNFELYNGSGILTQSGTLIAYDLSYTLSLMFEKDGNFRVIENFAGITLNSSGKWNFGSGVGKTKNKEEVFIKLDNITSGDTGNHLFNNFGTEFSYKIKELRNNELVITASSKGYMNSAGEKGVFQAEYSFTQ